jgi:folate-binding protein YgfZ
MSKLEAANLSDPPAALGVLSFTGPDAARFLQGQLSADIEKLGVGASTLAGLHNPQGRVVALLAVARAAPDEWFAVLPRELAGAVALRLRKYVLRSKLQIAQIGDALRVVGSDTGVDGLTTLAWGTRRILLVPEHRLGEFSCSDSAAARWQAADVAEGMPQVYAATSEMFVAQMLNLDLLGAIAFDKGCYTGQEVIARSHYRGRVKRRLQRWSADTSVPLHAGDAARSVDGRALSIVRVAPLVTGQELLAVGPYLPSEDPNAADSAAAADSSVRLAGPLPLPYRLPE